MFDASNSAALPAVWSHRRSPLKGCVCRGMEAGGRGDPGLHGAINSPTLFETGGVHFVWLDNWHERRKQLSVCSSQPGFGSVLHHEHA